MLTRANPDRDLICLCKKTVEALKADLAATNAFIDAEKVFDLQKPAYPVLPNGWFYSRCEDSAATLREAVKRSRENATPSWLADMRAQIKAVVAWQRQVAEVRRSSGLCAAMMRENRAISRTHDLVQRVAETPAATLPGVSWKALVAERWLKTGYGFHDEGQELMKAVLAEVRLLGTGGNNDGKIRVSHGYEVIEQEAPEMAAAA